MFADPSNTDLQLQTGTLKLQLSFCGNKIKFVVTALPPVCAAEKRAALRLQNIHASFCSCRFAMKVLPLQTGGAAVSPQSDFVAANLLPAFAATKCTFVAGHLFLQLRAYTLPRRNCGAAAVELWQLPPAIAFRSSPVTWGQRDAMHSKVKDCPRNKTSVSWKGSRNSK